MQPRIYTYKITFEEIPHWYWGVHKEKKYNDGYMGSPVTHKWMWEFYTPKIQILEVFPPTDEGWKEASQVELRLIRPELNNPLCLNEGCGPCVSLEISRRNGARLRDAMHSEKDSEGKSLHAIKMGQTGGKSQPFAVKHANGVKARDENLGMFARTKEEHSETSRLVGIMQRDQNKGIHLQTLEEKHEMGKKSMALRYIDPDHPELGERAAPILVNMQRARGYPSSRENRVRVE
jgi:hypothetical protein